MESLDLFRFNDEELKGILATVSAELDLRKFRDREAVIAKIQALAADAGIKLEDLQQPIAVKKRSRQAAAPKYHNPAAPDQTWSGRGRRPRWIDGDLENFRIMG